MNSEQLNSLQKELKISANKILQEEAEMIFLNELAENNLSARVAFYGGTALRLAYDSPRFSEDIDLFAIKTIPFSDFEKFINNIAEQQSWKLADLKDKRQTAFALFKIEDEKLKHPFSLKIELHKPKKRIELRTELRMLKSPVSIFSPLLLVPSLQELKKLKEEAIADRKKARDVFDLWYISQLERSEFRLPGSTPAFKKKEFENELKVFLPPKYHSVIDQLYEQTTKKDQ
ncbi:MAG TPA: nucleotidyl transferase AbiEii/AbiGii toxin family protein [Patescibacteria group bacterium]|nr:nucleotidyl transferase AbiEii/AbiGii toxin family protein [Patescibacteria group bacterium]